MGLVFKAIVVLVLLAGAGTLSYAYFGDMAADPTETRLPVALPELAPPPAPATAPLAPTGSAPAPGTSPVAPLAPAASPPPAGAGLAD